MPEYVFTPKKSEPPMPTCLACGGPLAFVQFMEDDYPREALCENPRCERRHLVGRVGTFSYVQILEETTTPGHE